MTILNGKYSPQSIQGSFDALLCRRKDENPSEDRYSSILPQNSPTNSTKFNRDIELGISKILHSWSQKKQSYHIYHNDRNSLHHQSCKNNDTLGLTGENKRRIFQKGSGRYALLAYICHIHRSETGSLKPEIQGNTPQIGENKKEILLNWCIENSFWFHQLERIQILSLHHHQTSCILRRSIYQDMLHNLNSLVVPVNKEKWFSCDAQLTTTAPEKQYPCNLHPVLCCRESR